MTRPYQITATVCVLFAVFVVRESVKLKLYTAMGPGPGFFPLWLSMFFGVLAVVMFSVIASLYIGNLILVILNLPLIPMWVAVRLHGHT